MGCGPVEGGHGVRVGGGGAAAPTRRVGLFVFIYIYIYVYVYKRIGTGEQQTLNQVLKAPRPTFFCAQGAGGLRSCGRWSRGEGRGGGELPHQPAGLVYLFLYTYIYMYMYINTYVYIYIYIFIFIFSYLYFYYYVYLY